MVGHHLTIEGFFIRLAELFESRKNEDHGSVFLTQKRFSKNDEIPQPDDPNSLADLHPPSALPIIVRATNGKSKEKHKDRVKISTVVRPEELETFYTRYAEVCKSGMQQLKKRDRKTRKKAKAKKRKEAEAEK